MTRRPMSVSAARAVIDAAVLVKAPDWSESRHWHVVSGGRRLLVIEPSYRGVSRTGRNGWIWWIADSARMLSRPEPTRQQAATVGLAAWMRWTTSKEQQ
ncbi:hypothetical protein [Streptomyces sp. SID10815]|uniref:hypothetical protein n=1 Tax=Streptomyces sp. SID10815 TaxID=2706027 RepID=UPI0013CB5BF6|nr:hypothetical protein [Streptomyces sp. SID10815]NEA52410.1 hypothetical protein [Streptomyces sp. SID10815]